MLGNERGWWLAIGDRIGSFMRKHFTRKGDVNMLELQRFCTYSTIFWQIHVCITSNRMTFFYPRLPVIFSILLSLILNAAITTQGTLPVWSGV